MISGVVHCCYLTYLLGIRYCNTLHPLQFRISLVHKEFSCVMESKGRKGRCLYNKKWERDTQYKGWVRTFKADKRKALCQWCDRTIDVLSMGESELKSHSKSKKHKQNSRCEQRVTLSSLGIFELHKGLITCTRCVKKALEKNVISPGKVLEKYLKRKASGLYEPWFVLHQSKKVLSVSPLSFAPTKG